MPNSSADPPASHQPEIAAQLTSARELEKAINGFPKFQAEFLAACKHHELDTNVKVVLLPEASARWWDENGDLKRDELEELGVAPAQWWPEPRGRYKLKVA